MKSPTSGASNICPIVAAAKDCLKLNFRKEEVKKFIRFMAEQDEVRIEIPIQTQCTEPQQSQTLAMIRP